MPFKNERNLTSKKNTTEKTVQTRLKEHKGNESPVKKGKKCKKQTS